ncbi:hypothetical protein TSUD_180610 [Trifolium subterraneum]|uniref:DUF4283 domain-containing protein n=1 Tax=Trifolium subterraneum TaxID=3900 RepID=A0A2Z6MY02_TRISU|nr:hypothetical protein TSUD_180610 [Trifolium subterraneum]
MEEVQTRDGFRNGAVFHLHKQRSFSVDSLRESRLDRKRQQPRLLVAEGKDRRPQRMEDRRRQEEARWLGDAGQFQKRTGEKMGSHGDTSFDRYDSLVGRRTQPSMLGEKKDFSDPGDAEGGSGKGDPSKELRVGDVVVKLGMHKVTKENTKHQKEEGATRVVDNFVASIADGLEFEVENGMRVNDLVSDAHVETDVRNVKEAMVMPNQSDKAVVSSSDLLLECDPPSLGTDGYQSSSEIQGCSSFLPPMEEVTRPTGSLRQDVFPMAPSTVKRTSSCPPGGNHSVVSGPWSLDWLQDLNQGDAGMLFSAQKRSFRRVGVMKGRGRWAKRLLQRKEWEEFSGIRSPDFKK